MKGKFGAFSKKELEEHISFVKNCWMNSKGSHNYSRFDSVHSKYEKDNQMNIRNIYPKAINLNEMKALFDS